MRGDDPNNELQSGDQDLQRLFGRLGNFDCPEQSCFLCGHSVLDGNYTSEHIIPKWAQKRYELWDQQLVLWTGSSIPYRQLTVPCCDDCNKYRLKPLEDSLAATVERGRDAVLALGKQLLFLWLGKIFYGLLYKEMSLLLDRSDPAGPRIITPEFIARYKSHRLLLQQARRIVTTVGFQPGSVFVFSMQGLPRKRMEWDFCDNIDTMFIGCRVGKVGLIAALADGGAQQLEEEIYSNIQGLELHPLQFRELCARVAYLASLATRTPKYITIQSSPHQIHQMPLGGFSMKPLFEEWDQATYAQYLAHYMGKDVKSLYEPPDKVWTWLYTPEGKPQFISFQEFPIL